MAPADSRPTPEPPGSDPILDPAQAVANDPMPEPGRASRLSFGLGDLPPQVIVLTAVAFAVALGFGILAPAIPLFAKQFDVSNFDASAVVSVFALLRLVSAPFAGRMVDRVGERIVMASGIGIVGVSSLVAGFSASYVQLLVLRGAGGVGSAMFSVSSTSLILRVAAPAQRGRAVGAYQSGFLFGGITGPVFGGVLIAWSLRAPFFVYAGTLLVAGTVAVVYLARAELEQRDAAPKHPPTPLRTALRSRAYLAALANNFATGWSVNGVRSALVPLFVVAALHLHVWWVGVGLFVSSVVQGVFLVPVGRLVDERGRRPFLRAGAVVTLVAALALAFGDHLWTFVLAMALYGAGSAMLATSTAAIVGDVIGGRGGTAVAAYQMSSDAGTFAGPLVAGSLSDLFSFRAAFLATAGVSALAALAAIPVPETGTRQPETNREAASG
jgi:MFS transporter, DHA1 family, multidrug resistance protein